MTVPAAALAASPTTPRTLWILSYPGRIATRPGTVLGPNEFGEYMTVEWLAVEIWPVVTKVGVRIATREETRAHLEQQMANHVRLTAIAGSLR